MRKGSARSIVCLLGLASAAQADNLVQNGNFQTGDFSNWTFTGSSTNISVQPGLGRAGSYGAFFANTDLRGIRQTLSVKPDSRIQVSFWLFSYDGGFNQNEFQVSLGGTTIFSGTNVGPFGYTEFTGTFDVIPANPVLEFRFRNTPANFRLDDITAVNLVPLPTGAAVGLAGLAGVGVIARVRRRRGF